MLGSLVQIENVHSIANAKQIRLDQSTPRSGLVTEVNASFHHLRYGHHRWHLCKEEAEMTSRNVTTEHVKSSLLGLRSKIKLLWGSSWRIRTIYVSKSSKVQQEWTTSVWDSEVDCITSLGARCVISDTRGPVSLSGCEHTFRPRQWNWLSDIAWCMFKKCDQWCSRTILSGCEYTSSLGILKLTAWYHQMNDRWCKTASQHCPKLKTKKVKKQHGRVLKFNPDKNTHIKIVVILQNFLLQNVQS